MDYSKYLYFLDGDGDIARKARGARKGGSKKPAKVVKAAAKKLAGVADTHADCPGCPECPPCPPTGKRPAAAKKSSGGKKSSAVLEREIAAVLTPKKKRRG
jgi:hypothetical protein